MKKIVGKYESYSRGNDIYNIIVSDLEKNNLNLKVTEDQLNSLTIGKAYEFTYETKVGEVRNTHFLKKATLIEEVLKADELSHALKTLYEYAPIEQAELKKQIDQFLNEITNKNFKIIVDGLYKKYENKFFVHPAATKFHHAFVGGLAYHTLNMLKGSKVFLDIYPFLNKDLLYAGIFIHDLAKIDEISGIDGEYTNEGILLGHLVIISNEIERIAIKNKIENSEEALLLKHVGISHHGIPNFGAAKKPQTGEALLIWYLDNIDARLETLGLELEKTEAGKFTEQIGVIDRMRFYKPKLEDK